MSLDGVDDAEGFHRTSRAMRAMGVSEEESEETFHILASLLHLGNISFASKSQVETKAPQAEAKCHSSSAGGKPPVHEAGEDVACVDIVGMSALRRACALMRCDEEQLRGVVPVDFVTI